ncbi:hypothetical protein F3Y22_tig00111410pilonHSYRG00088 [Hibiscus syriacus]|uniref:RRM domain-containing protein n=1 Tax=Hibiscus syriacus TaxID=106335 RepID=A0A6A2XRU4_HIBSY|nr:hypothetical protein F3Y22_tig00111410pilonHSYRG00088 [Hibiscus syriacus]
MSEKVSERVSVAHGIGSSDRGGALPGEGVWVAFIDNLSRRVHRSVLWERFSYFGKVIKVFIPFVNRRPKYKDYTFAFVHFASKEDLFNAKDRMNNVVVDGRKISVSIAKYHKRGFLRGREQVPGVGSGVEREKESCGKRSISLVETRKRELLSKFHDGRSYKESVVGRDIMESQQRNSGCDVKGGKKTLDVHIPLEERTWLRSSLTGIFGEEKTAAVKDKWEALSFWFERLEPVMEEKGVPLSFCAVSLMGVPLNCWSVSFFSSLAERWGKLVKIQDQTAQRVDCRVAQLLIRVESPFDIPSQLDDGVEEAGSVEGRVGPGEETHSEGNKGDDREELQGQLNFQSMSGAFHGVDTLFDGNLNLNVEVNDIIGTVQSDQGTVLGDVKSKKKVSETLFAERKRMCSLGGGSSGQDKGVKDCGIIPKTGRYVEIGPEQIGYISPAQCCPVDNESNFQDQTLFQTYVENSSFMGEEVKENSKELEEWAKGDKECKSKKAISNPMGKRCRRWRVGYQVSKGLSISNTSEGVRGCGRFVRVYRRSKTRRVWLCSENSHKHSQNRLVLHNFKQFSSASRDRGQVKEIKGGADPSIISKSRRLYRKKRRGLIADALASAEVSTVYSRSFSKVLEEALNTWEVCQSLGISFKEGREAFMDKIRMTEEGAGVVNEAGRKEKIRGTSRLVNKIKPVILFLQETKLNKSRKGLKRKLGGKLLKGASFQPADGSAGRLMCLWNDNVFEANEVGNHSRFQMLKGRFKVSKMECVFINVYGPSVEEEKEEFFSQLLSFVHSVDLPLCIGGDFNAYLEQEEKIGASQNWHSMGLLRNFLQHSNLIDLPLVGGTFTWGSNREVTTWVRLDRFLLSSSFLSCFPKVVQKLLPRSLSDHNPILLAEDGKNWGPKPFRFFNYLMEEDGFVDMVQNVVSDRANDRGGSRMFNLLKGTKKRIKEWPIRSKQGISEAITGLESKFYDLEIKAQSSGLSSLDWEQLLSSRNELWKLYRIEESIWFQLSREKWIKDGDRNTRFFHLCAVNRNRFNSISELKVDGEVLTDPEVIKVAVSQFFKKAYNSRDFLEVENLNLNFDILREEQRTGLEVIFSEEKVREAIFSSDSSKAPGPDGFTMGFYKKVWPIIKGNLMKFMEDFYYGRKWDHGVNHAFISLIPKKGNPKCIEDYRPISLVGSLYKIVSKVLAKRLVSVIQDIVSPSQFAFIPGRQLLDCAFIANEGIDSWRKRGLKGVVFKADFQRAYDSVEWPIIFRLLRVMGFGERWVSWIKCCLSTALISVLVNGSPTEEFSMGKGLRQGCSLSPLLFNLVGELLNRMLMKAADVGFFQGFTFGRSDALSLTHLQFADDLIVFCRDSSTYILNIKRVLRTFSIMIGLHLNMSKSNLYGINVEGEVLNEWAKEIGCAVGVLPTVYLGLPLGAKRNSEALWEPVMQSFNKKLFGWKASSLSMAGRLVLIKSVLSSLPIFFLSIFRILKEGGLGILDLNFANRVLLDLNKVISHSDSWIWKGITRNYLAEDAIGNGLRSHSKIQVEYALSNNKWGKVSEFGSIISNKWIWNIHTRRNLCDWEMEHWIRLMTLLENIGLSDSVDDFLAWSGKGDGLFTAKACRLTLSSNSRGSLTWKKFVWSGFAPPRVETFLWQVSHQRLAVRSELIKRGVTLEEVSCPLCAKQEETVQHLFISCQVAWDLWSSFWRLWGVSSVLPNDPASLLCSWSDLRPKSLIWDFIPGVVLWSLWKARNSVVFDDGKLDKPKLFFLCRFRLVKWFLAKYPNDFIQVDSLVGDPSLADKHQTRHPKRMKVQEWLPPPLHFFKVNVDGAVSGDGLFGGMGGILRDSESKILGSFSLAVGPGPPPLAEMKAIEKGIEFFLSSEWATQGRLIIESDCKKVVDWILQPTSSPPFLRLLVQKIASLISERAIIIRHIPRSCNCEADTLAKQGIG